MQPEPRALLTLNMQ